MCSISAAAPLAWPSLHDLDTATVAAWDSVSCSWRNGSPVHFLLFRFSANQSAKIVGRFTVITHYTPWLDFKLVKTASEIDQFTPLWNLLVPKDWWNNEVGLLWPFCWYSVSVAWEIGNSVSTKSWKRMTQRFMPRLGLFPTYWPEELRKMFHWLTCIPSLQSDPSKNARSVRGSCAGPSARNYWFGAAKIASSSTKAETQLRLCSSCWSMPNWCACVGFCQYLPQMCSLKLMRTGRGPHEVVHVLQEGRFYVLDAGKKWTSKG